MIQLQPLRCINTRLNDITGDRHYYYAPQGTTKPIYHIYRLDNHSHWVCFIEGYHSYGDPRSFNFDYVLRQMHIHYRTVYRKQITEIIL